jgi:UPF0755 protein
MERFKMVAGKMSYPSNVKSGRFIDKGMNSYELVKAMQIQCSCKISIQPRTIENLAGRVLKLKLTVHLLNSFKDSIFLKENGFNEDNVMVMFIPNTYEILEYFCS